MTRITVRLDTAMVEEMDLTAQLVFRYAVLMEEQMVRYIEKSGGHQEPVAVSGVPAPMVERAFRVLDLLSTSEEGLTFSVLARALQMSKGDLHGLLKTLESSGAIEQEENHRYVLGSRVYDLARAYIQRAGLRRLALPAMRRLALQPLLCRRSS